MNKGILVIGDIMLDKYVYGVCDRISPEAPIPIINYKKEKNSLGGAANVANNVECLGVDAYLIGLLGIDTNADVLGSLIEKNNIKNHTISSSDIITITKTRILGNNQQICRIDEESKNHFASSIESKIEEKLSLLMPKIDIIIISDYDKGILSTGTVRKICKYADKYEIDVLVDPKFLDWSKYNGAKYITPNFKEFSYAVNKNISNSNADIEKYGKELLSKYKIDNIIVTRAENGISLINKDDIIHVPTNTKKVYDVTGAGDTVIATIAFCLLKKIDLKTTLDYANKAASIVIKKLGANAITIKDLNSFGFNK